MRGPRILVALAALAVGAAACSSSPSSPNASASPTVVIGSTNFSEQLIVANLYSDVLQHAGVKTVLKTNLVPAKRWSRRWPTANSTSTPSTPGPCFCS